MHMTYDVMESKRVLRLSILSLFISFALMAIKFIAFERTNSEAILSDALESIVNVVAAIAAFLVIRVAMKPADRDHPYGHGKAEYFSSAFEGGLIAFAAMAIFVDATRALIRGYEVEEIGFGIFLTSATGVVNAIYGWHLIREGKKLKSSALQASGAHLISDFVTTVAVVLGLVLVLLTKIVWIDAVVAYLAALNLLWSGLKIFRRSTAALMDEEDDSLIREIADLFTKNFVPGIIRIHATRVIRSGRYHHIDSHVVVPEFWDIKKAHDITDNFEKRVISDYSYDGEVHFHVDPCRRAYCRVCDLKDCSVREEPFEKRIPLSVNELINPDEPDEFS